MKDFWERDKDDVRTGGYLPHSEGPRALKPKIIKDYTYHHLEQMMTIQID